MRFSLSCYPDGNFALHHHATETMLWWRIFLEVDMKEDLMSMSVDQLWDLHTEVVAKLSIKIEAEKRKLEQRLAQLDIPENKPNARRPYPKVRPKYRNPERPSETWSGRGKQPHWVAAQLRSGKKFDELLIAQTH
jgi:DNA-binding protein H-NS